VSARRCDDDVVHRPRTWHFVMHMFAEVKECAKRAGARLPYTVQEIVLSGYFYFKSKRIHGRAFVAALEELSASEGYGQDQLNVLQAGHLRRVVAAATHTPYYSKLFRESGIDPARIRTAEDLKMLPLLEKDAVRRHPGDFVDRRLNRRSLQLSYTSGTTGTPLRLYLSPDYEALEEAFVVRQWRWAGLSVTDRRVRLRGDLIVPAGRASARPWLRNYADHELRMSSYHLNKQTIRSYVERINSFGARAIIAYPSSASLLAALVEEEKLECHIPLVFTSSESLSASQRELVRRRLGARIFDHYGMTEGVVAIQECEFGGLHVLPEYGITEFVPSEDQGMTELHEIVATGFTNSAMPLLRYRTGDHARIVPGATCACCRAFPVVKEILGRSDDFVVAASGALAGRMDHVFKGLSDIVEAQIIQEEDGGIRVLVVPGEGYAESLRDSIKDNVQQRVGPLPVSVEEVSMIPRGVNGKFRTVVSRRVRKPLAS